MKVLAQIDCFRFVEKGVLEINGMPDFRLQTQDWYTKRWCDSYLFDNFMQMQLAMDDLDYARWLTNQPCYIRE